MGHKKLFLIRVCWRKHPDQEESEQRFREVVVELSYLIALWVTLANHADPHPAVAAN